MMFVSLSAWPCLFFVFWWVLKKINKMTILVTVVVARTQKPEPVGGADRPNKANSHELEGLLATNLFSRQLSSVRAMMCERTHDIPQPENGVPLVVTPSAYKP